jgi:hypothetical protein
MFVLLVSFIPRPRIALKAIKQRLRIETESDGDNLIDGGSSQSGERSRISDSKSAEKPLRITNLRSMWIEQHTSRALGYGPQRKMEIQNIESGTIRNYNTSIGLLKGNTKKLLNATRYKTYDIIFEEDERAKIIKAIDDREADQFEEVRIAGSIKKTFLSNSKSSSGRGVVVIEDVLLFLSHRGSTLLMANLKDLEQMFLKPDQEVQTIRVQEDTADFAVDSNRVVTVTEKGLITIYRLDECRLTRLSRAFTSIYEYPFQLVATTIGYSAGQILVSCYSEKKKSEFLFHLNKYKSVCSRILNEGKAY